MSRNLITPVVLFRVLSTAVAETHYCGLLGFMRRGRTPDADGEPAYLWVERDDVHVHLSSHAGDGVFRSISNIAVRDVDALYEEFTARGVAIALPPTDQTWGNREMYVRDPDGNTLRFIRYPE